MKVIQRIFNNWSRPRVIRIYPIGDVHLGSAACDERLFKSVIKTVQDDPDGYWIFMGDACDWISLKDPRFDVKGLARWLWNADSLSDIAKAQEDRFCEYVEPIAGKCLAVLKGNHEETQEKYYERDVYSNIVTRIKKMGNMKSDTPLGLGYAGWLRLQFRRANVSGATVTFNLHHGFGGGRKAGAHANRIEEWLWIHDADVTLFGHTHRTLVQPVVVQSVNDAGEVVEKKRVGLYTGSFLRTNIEDSTTYSERAGYSPLPIGGVMLQIRPHAEGGPKIQTVY